MIFGGFEKCTLIDYPGKTACMVYTIGCNFRCPYCHNPELVDETVKETVSEEEILSFLNTRKNLLDGVVITGGEPTLHEEDLLSFMEKVKEKGFLIKLDSNGTRPHILKEAIDRKLVDYIAMDIKSPLRLYSQTVARPIDVEKIKESINLLKKDLVDYELRTTLVKGMLMEEDIIEMAKEIEGAKKYVLQAFVSNKILNPQFKKKVSYSKEEMEYFRKKIEIYVKQCFIR